MKKPTVYLETSAISAYSYEGADVSMLARRFHTREWWELERRHFDLWASGIVEAELAAGSFRRQDECLRMVRRFSYLVMDAMTGELRAEILRRGLVPSNKDSDAAHLAISASHRIDYLITWNYAHIANPFVQERLKGLCAEFKAVAPSLVSPEQIPQVRFGQSIRREQKNGRRNPR